MQINIHNFTLTTARTATITITGSDETLNEYPEAVFKVMATVEALDLTGYEWEMSAAVAPQPGTVVVHLNKI